MGTDQEPQPLPVTIPILPGEAFNQLRQALNMDYFQSPVTSGEPPGRLIDDLAFNTFDKISSLGGAIFVKAISDELQAINTTLEGTTYRYKIDYETKGMALVLRAYELSLGIDLLTNLGRLQGEDLERVRQIIRDNTPRAGTTTTILEQVLSEPRIPEQHAFLTSFLNEFINLGESAMVDPRFTKGGAVTMFKVLTALWPKIAPQTSEPPDLPPQPDQPDLG